MKHLEKKYSVTYFIIVLFLLSSIILFTVLYQNRIKKLERTGFYFDTVITITLYNTTDEKILDDCFAKCAYYESLFSRTKKGTDIWNLNHACGEAITVSPETFDLMSQAKSYYDETDGLLDFTIAPVVSLWNFKDTDNPSLPNQTQLDESLTHVDGSKINLISPNMIQLTDQYAEIDLGCFAKGYVADCLKKMLINDYQITSGIINLGGNVLTIGNRPDETDFRIGIKSPFDIKNTTVTFVNCNDCSVVTSGIYERCFELEGVNYHHILDPVTGYPVQNDLISVTILSKDSLIGDAYSTLCMLLGRELGMDFINNTEGVEAVFLTKENEYFYSDGFPVP